MNARPLIALSGALAVAAGCRAGPAAPHTTLDAKFAPLRAAFNADSGTVRAIFLASPA
jgi:hypothetical protein